MACGETYHLTSFSLLLTGKNNNTKCNSENDYILAWLSLGLVGLAVIICLIAVLLIEIKIRVRRLTLDKFFIEVQRPPSS